MEDKQPATFHGDRPNLQMDRERVPPPRPKAECLDLVRYPDKAAATLRVVNGPRGMSDGSTPNPAATYHLETRPEPKTTGTVASTSGEPSKSREATARPHSPCA
jgi:hypothetical protein